MAGKILNTICVVVLARIYEKLVFIFPVSQTRIFSLMNMYLLFFYHLCLADILFYSILNGLWVPRYKPDNSVVAIPYYNWPRHHKINPIVGAWHFVTWLGAWMTFMCVKCLFRNEWVPKFNSIHNSIYNSHL